MRVPLSFLKSAIHFKELCRGLFVSGNIHTKLYAVIVAQCTAGKDKPAPGTVLAKIFFLVRADAACGFKFLDFRQAGFDIFWRREGLPS